MDDDLAALWSASDQVLVGQRLRTARRQANLSQTELGGEVASPAYISRLEAGTRRGDLGLFIALAQRLRIDVRDLLGGRARADDESRLRLRVDYAELALATGDATGAELGVVDVTDNALDSLSPDLARSIRRVRAGAYEAQGRLAAAIAEGEKLAAVRPRDLSWITDLIALSRCYRESGDLVRAIAVGSEAESEIERVNLSGTTEAVQLAVTVAAAHASKGDLVYAAQLCRRAIERADAIQSPIASASAYWNASVFEFEQGRVAEAIPLARRALGEFEKGEDSRNLGRLRGALGVLLTQVEPPALSEAVALLLQSRRELEASSAGRYDLGRSSWALARAYFRLGDRQAAQSALDDAGDLVDSGAPLMMASVLVLRGRFAFADGLVDTAREYFRDAIHTLSGIGSDRGAGELWFELAELLEQTGDTAGALTAYKSAAASAGFLGRTAEKRATSSEPADPA